MCKFAKSGRSKWDSPATTHLIQKGRAQSHRWFRKESKESIMVRRTKRVWIILAVSALVATGSLLGHAAAQKVSVPKPQDKLALGEEDVKQLLLLMDTDRHGKVSRQEYMKFMEAEFNRLDRDKTGELDVKTLTQSNLTVSRFVGK